MTKYCLQNTIDNTIWLFVSNTISLEIWWLYINYTDNDMELKFMLMFIPYGLPEKLIRMLYVFRIKHASK